MNILTKRKLKKKVFAAIIGQKDANKSTQEIVNLIEIYVTERDVYQLKLEQKLRRVRNKLEVLENGTRS